MRLAVDRTVNEAFKFNQETQMVPILGLVENQLNASKNEDDDEDKDKSDSKKKVATKATDISSNHHPALLGLLAEELSVAPEQIHDFELYV